MDDAVTPPLTTLVWQPLGGAAALHPDGLEAVTGGYAADGRELLTGHSDGRVRAWDVTTGQPGRVFDEQYGRVGFCAYSPNGRRVLAGGTDRSARMWDTATADPVGFRFEALPDGDAVTWAAPGGSPVDRTPGAGRWLGRSVIDPGTGRSTWVPHREE